jgi:hypothetical protein
MSLGAGIVVCGKTVRIVNSTIRKNHGGRGAGITGTAENLLVADNRIEGNICYDDHGGGVYLWGKKLRLSRNLVAGNRISFDYGWGGGILIHTAGTTARLDVNIIRDNYAPSYGGGVFVDEGASAYLSHDLIYRNRTAVICLQIRSSLIRPRAISISGLEPGATIQQVASGSRMQGRAQPSIPVIRLHSSTWSPCRTADGSTWGFTAIRPRRASGCPDPYG